MSKLVEACLAEPLFQLAWAACLILYVDWQVALILGLAPCEEEDYRQVQKLLTFMIGLDRGDARLRKRRSEGEN